MRSFLAEPKSPQVTNDVQDKLRKNRETPSPPRRRLLLHPVIWHGTGACHGLFIPETLLVLRMSSFVLRS